MEVGYMGGQRWANVRGQYVGGASERGVGDRSIHFGR